MVTVDLLGGPVHRSGACGGVPPGGHPGHPFQVQRSLLVYLVACRHTRTLRILLPHRTLNGSSLRMYDVCNKTCSNVWLIFVFITCLHPWNVSSSMYKSAVCCVPIVIMLLGHQGPYYEHSPSVLMDRGRGVLVRHSPMLCRIGCTTCFPLHHSSESKFRVSACPSPMVQRLTGSLLSLHCAEPKPTTTTSSSLSAARIAKEESRRTGTVDGARRALWNLPSPLGHPLAQESPHHLYPPHTSVAVKAFLAGHR